MEKIIIILLFLSLGANAQVVNVEQERIKSDTTGIAGTTQVAFQYMKNKSEVFNIEGDIHLQYKTNKSLFLILTDYTFSKAAGADYANAGTQHIRYNYKIKPWLYPEVFTQAQFNRMLNVKFRWLIGAGPRFTLIKTKTLNTANIGELRMYTGILYMYEYEELTNSVYNRDHRVSSYVSLSCRLGKNISVINTTYYQPKINQFKDYRLSSQTDLKIVFSKHFAFKVSYFYFFDAFPALDAPKETQNLSNALSFEF